MNRFRQRLSIYMLVVTLFCSVIAKPAQADLWYAHTRNENLREQLLPQSGRALPQFDQFSWALDAYLFKPWSGYDNFFHGSGYWLNLFTEWRPVDSMALNFRLAPYYPSSSYGYAKQAEILQTFGFTWTPRFVPEGWRGRVRFGDLDRQTLGTGLLLQDKEVNGFSFLAGQGEWDFRLRIDGTGGFFEYGDLYTFELLWRSGQLGFMVNALRIKGENSPLNDDPAEILNWTENPTFYSLYSYWPMATGWRLLGEGSYHHGGIGALGGVDWQRAFPNRWRVKARADYRLYQTDFVHQVAGVSNYDYVTPEVLDKAYTDPRTLLSHAGGLQAVSGQFEVEYRLSPEFGLNGYGEALNQWNARGGREHALLYKCAFSYFPNAPERRDQVSAYVSNKNLNGYGPVKYGVLVDNQFRVETIFGLDIFIYL